MTKIVQTRVVIYPQDVERLTGRSASYSRKLIAKLKKDLGKTAKQYITIDEFCTFTGLSKDNVMAKL